MQKAAIFLVLCWLSVTALQAGYFPLDLSGVFGAAGGGTYTTIPTPNGMGLKNGSLFPTASVTVYGDVPLNLTGAVWSGDKAAGFGAGPVSAAIFGLNLTKVTAVYTAMDSEWGQTIGNGAFASVTLGFSGGTYTVDIMGDQDIRDYNSWNWTNTVTYPNAVNFWNDGSLGQRLDAQQILVPAAFQSQTLQYIIVNDGGDHVVQRLLLSAITVATVSSQPEPGTIASMLGGIALLIAWRKRR
jgi:hypothetical protein